MGAEPGPGPAAGADGLSWAVIEALESQSLNTLVHAREFTVLSVTPHVVKLRLKETGRTAYVERFELQKAFEALVTRGSLTIWNIHELGVRRRSYVAALLTELPGVVWDMEKSLLRFSGGGPAVRPPAEAAPSPREPEAPSFDTSWASQGDDVLEGWRKLNPAVQREIIGITLADAAMLVRTLGPCESVLEQLLAAHLLSVARTVALVEEVTVEPQHEVETSAGRFRVDFLVRGRVEGRPVRLAVECDGHTYHDKTKEQAARDRQRDRALKLAGYDVIRFAGTEILEDPEECALEVFRQVMALARRGSGDAEG